MIDSSGIARVINRLEQLVMIETPTGDAEGIDHAQCLVESWLSGVLGAAGQRETVDGVSHLLWPGPERPTVLLLGHLDTVFPRGTTTERPFQLVADRATGPGVFDMKAGIVIMAEALARVGRPGAVSVLLTSDEEVGSITSRGIIEREAARAGSVLVLEPSLDGALKISRRGGSIYRLDFHGRAAHAGLDPAQGRNALVELAYQVLAVLELGSDDEGTTVSPTVAHAGTVTNVIPATAHLKIDARAWTMKELDRVHSAMSSLVARTPDVHIEMTGGINRPPMEDDASRELLEITQQVAERLDLPKLGAVSAGGASDGNFTAAVGARTLDGLGPRGAGAHGADEWVSIQSTLERIALMVGLIDELSAIADR